MGRGSTTTQTSLTDFSDGIEKLEPNGANWVIFQRRFLIAVRCTQLYGHFDGSSKMPTAMQASSSPVGAGNAEKTMTRGAAGAGDIDAAITAWQEKEDLALHLLTQKLPNSIFAKYMRKKTVAEMWAAIVKEFTQKLMVMKPHLRSEFMAMRYEKGANLRSEFDTVRMKYEVLLDAGVKVSDDEYCSLIIKFVPSDIANFISQLSTTVKGLLRSGTATSSAESPGSSDELGKEPFVIKPEILMVIATEEWERRDAYKKSRKLQQESSNTNAGTVSSENPDSNVSGGHSRGRGRGRRRGGQ